jgi:hypothetical protein
MFTTETELWHNSMFIEEIETILISALEIIGLVSTQLLRVCLTLNSHDIVPIRARLKKVFY